MGSYCGDVDDQGHAVLWYEADGDRAPVPLVVKHSPQGLAWGGEGEGALDTALSILGHFTRDPRLADRHHEEFTSEFLARLRLDEPFEMESAAVEGWLRDRRVALTEGPCLDSTRARATTEAWSHFEDTMDYVDRYEGPPWERCEGVVAAVKEWMANFALDLRSGALDRDEADLELEEAGVGRAEGLALGSRHPVEGPRWSSDVEDGWARPYDVLGDWDWQQLSAALDATVTWLRAHGHPTMDRARAIEEAVGNWRRSEEIESREDALHGRSRSLLARRSKASQVEALRSRRSR
ncbi:MAG: hypothetical protein KY439_00920 [Actinobacteria bacterium]|nr:hypothetical protein [Actinomycetota bacterium]